MASGREGNYVCCDSGEANEFGEVIRRDTKSGTPPLAQGAYGFPVLRPREAQMILAHGHQAVQHESWPAALFPGDMDGVPLTSTGFNPYLLRLPQPAINAFGWQVSDQASQRGFKAASRNWRHRERSRERQPPQVVRVKERCKYFQEGRCNRSDSCPFSHDFKPPKKAELCKYYVQSSCRNGDSCVYMHSEWPCKFFHLYRSCNMAHGQCKFSHGPTTPEMAGILQQICDGVARPKLTPIAEPSPKRYELFGELKPAVACFPEDRAYLNRSEIGCCSSSMDDSEDSDQGSDKDSNLHVDSIQESNKYRGQDSESGGYKDPDKQDKDWGNGRKDDDTEDKDCGREGKSDDKDRDDTPALELARGGRSLKADCSSPPPTTSQPRWQGTTRVTRRSSRLTRLRATGSSETGDSDGEPEEASNAFEQSKRRRKL